MLKKFTLCQDLAGNGESRLMGVGFLFCVDEYILKLVIVVVAQLYEYMKNH